MVDTELTVSLPLTVRVKPDGSGFNGLVQAVQAAGAEACRTVLEVLVRAVERDAQEREPQRWENRGQQTRHVQTVWGRVAVRRTRVRERATGRTYNLADELLGWTKYTRRDWASVETACELAAAMPYRAACHWWRRLTGQSISVMGFWRMVQRGGRALVDWERDGVGEIAADEPLPEPVKQVYLEADGAWLRRQKPRRQTAAAEEAGVSSGGSGTGSASAEPAPGGLLLHVGVSYSRLEATGRRRRNAVDKQVCVEVEDLERFAQQWRWQVWRRWSLASGPQQLFLCDGDEGLLRTGRRCFPEALVQIDRFHVHQHLGRAFGLRTPGYRTALRALCRGELGTVRSLLALRGRGPRAAPCREARTYIDRHVAWLYTHRIWERLTGVRKMGSGVTEKTIETQINRRMKRQGMSWSPAGADRLAKLRVLERRPAGWRRFWSQIRARSEPASPPPAGP